MGKVLWNYIKSNIVLWSGRRRDAGWFLVRHEMIRQWFRVTRGNHSSHIYESYCIHELGAHKYILLPPLPKLWNHCACFPTLSFIILSWSCMIDASMCVILAINIIFLIFIVIVITPAMTKIVIRDTINPYIQLHMWCDKNKCNTIQPSPMPCNLTQCNTYIFVLILDIFLSNSTTRYNINVLFLAWTMSGMTFDLRSNIGS